MVDFVVDGAFRKFLILMFCAEANRMMWPKCGLAHIILKIEVWSATSAQFIIEIKQEDAKLILTEYIPGSSRCFRWSCRFIELQETNYSTDIDMFVDCLNTFQIWLDH